MKQAILPVVILLAAASVGRAQVESLPAPVVNPNSFEIVANSRYSSHSGFTSSLSRQVLANVLWAMHRAPSLGGAYREYYVATPQNVYTYDPAGHVLNVHLAGNHRYSSNSAFEIGIAVPRPEDAGLAIEAGLLAGVAFWSRGSGSVAQCPMAFAANYANSNWNPVHTIQMVNVYGLATLTGLTDSCVARSSDSTLPRPRTDGPDTFEVALADLGQDTVFDAAMPTLANLSQLLWAGYGVTPHMPMSKRGLTVPSAVANYYLTRRIYLAADTAVFRYHNRIPPGTNQATSDHRLERVTSGDRRNQLRAACPRLPATAPAYIVLSVADTTNAWQTMEPGFVALHYLVQARLLGLAGHILAPLTTAERSAIQTALGMPAADYPVLVFSAGNLLTPVAEPPPEAGTGFRIRALAGPLPRVEYTLPLPGEVRISIHDLAGRELRTWDETRPAGTHVAEWSGTGDDGRLLATGAYLCTVTFRGEAAAVRLTLTR